MKEKSKFYMGCHLAGRKYHEADLVWDQLRVGMPLRLEREADNRYDPEAVQVILNSDGEDFLLVYIPRGENQRIAPEEHPEEQIQMTVRIRRKEETDAEIENANNRSTQKNCK